MERLNYREMVEMLAVANRWLCQLGLNHFDGIRIHTRNIAELTRLLDDGKLAEMAGESAQRSPRSIFRNRESNRAGMQCSKLHSPAVWRPRD